MSELEVVIAELEAALDRCRSGLMRSSELLQLMIESGMRTQNALPPDSDAFRIFDRGIREETVWTKQTTSGYTDPGDCARISRRRDLVRKVANTLEPEFLRDAARPKRQHYFEAGESYRAMRLVYSVFASATSTVDVVDEYLDADVFDYVRSLEPSLQWRLLTSRKKPIFPKLLAPTLADGFQVQARENTACHDRFIILDGASAWHLGTSLNGLGKKAFMLNEVSDADERSRFLSDFSGWWAAGATI